MKTAGKHPGTIRARCPACGKRRLVVGTAVAGQRAFAVSCAREGGCGWRASVHMPDEFDERDGGRFLRALKRNARQRLQADRMHCKQMAQIDAANQAGARLLSALALPESVIKRGPACAGCSIDGLCKTQDDGHAFGCAGRH